MININNPKNKPLHREAYLYRAYGGKRAKSADIGAAFQHYYAKGGHVDLLSSRTFQGGVSPSKVTSPRKGKSFARNYDARPTMNYTGVKQSGYTRHRKRYDKINAIPCKSIAGQRTR